MMLLLVTDGTLNVLYKLAFAAFLDCIGNKMLHRVRMELLTVCSVSVTLIVSVSMFLFLDRFARFEVCFGFILITYCKMLIIIFSHVEKQHAASN